jgi:radical SAM superfamily enzyme YgiQ (UPF0313 family)
MVASCMTRLDAAFVHIPRWRGQRREIMVMPLGLPALANLLADQGRTVKLLHAGIEREADPAFSMQAWAQQHAPRLVLLPLHWHQQTRAVVQAAEKLRAWLPEATIVLGGLTASVFARELMEALPFVDCVVRGDGEQPLLQLAGAVLDGSGAMGEVPNLLWREDGRIRENGRRWALTAEFAAGLRHGDLSLLQHAEAYVQRPLYADFSEGVRDSGGYGRTAYLNAGRGCHCDCAMCGGAASGQQLTSARNGILPYPLGKLMRDVNDAAATGAEALRMSFDPPPARGHILRWMEAIRAEGLRLRVFYDAWYLPGAELLGAIARTFAPGSLLVLSPECGSEEVRMRVRGMPFSNARLLRSIQQAEGLGLRVHCFFSAGLPTESPAQVQETARLIETIQRSSAASMSVCPMVLDPASPVFVDPERFGVRLLRRTLGDFYDEKGLADGPGYETQHFDEAGILAACDSLLRLVRAAALG